MLNPEKSSSRYKDKCPHPPVSMSKRYFYLFKFVKWFNHFTNLRYRVQSLGIQSVKIARIITYVCGMHQVSLQLDLMAKNLLIKDNLQK